MVFTCPYCETEYADYDAFEEAVIDGREDACQRAMTCEAEAYGGEF